MSINIAEEQRIPALLILATDTIPVEAGKTLKVETSPDGEELFNRQVPEGKQWQANLTVQITETDV